MWNAKIEQKITKNILFFFFLKKDMLPSVLAVVYLITKIKVV